MCACLLWEIGSLSPLNPDWLRHW